MLSSTPLPAVHRQPSPQTSVQTARATAAHPPHPMDLSNPYSELTTAKLNEIMELLKIYRSICTCSSPAQATWYLPIVPCAAKCGPEWFHLSCVGLAERPLDSVPWFCPGCREKEGGLPRLNGGADGKERSTPGDVAQKSVFESTWVEGHAETTDEDITSSRVKIEEARHEVQNEEDNESDHAVHATLYFPNCNGSGKRMAAEQEEPPVKKRVGVGAESKKSGKSGNESAVTARSKYCTSICNEAATDDMIGCDGGCAAEWYHFECVGLTEVTLPEGEWYCAGCEGAEDEE